MPRENSTTTDKPSVQVIERIFLLLDVLSKSNGPMTLKEISEQSGLHPSTTHRILNDLAMGRFVDRPGPGSYRLGLRLMELGNLVKARLNVLDVAYDTMQALHEAVVQPVNLSISRGDEIVYVERAFNPRSGMHVIRAIGERAPKHLTSAGKLFLSTESEAAVRAYAERTGLPGNTGSSITQLSALMRELVEIRQRGISRDDEELEPGVRCLAAGIYDSQGKLVACLSISAPAGRVEKSWEQKLLDATQSISARLGYQPRR